jgi:aminoglycoside/choline kinase family phosphotransferase
MLQTPMLAEVLVPFVRGFAGGSGGTVETLVGDASTRRYHRVHVAGGNPASAVVMELPDEPLKSDEATGADRPPELPFLNVQRYLAAGGYPVPRVYHADLARGLIALEDLGDRTFESVVKPASAEERGRLYRAAIDQIVALQELGARAPDPGCLAFSRRFDEKLLRWELGHFREWYLEAQRGVTLPAAASAAVEAAFDRIAATLAAEPVTLVHRDFQSRNLMMLPAAGPRADEAGAERSQLRVIDFQDALLGTRAYDLVALLRDSYVELAPAEVDALVGYFVERSGIADAGAFRRLFTLQTLQRKLKDAGRFVFIDRVRNNPSFLRWIPTTITYVRDALATAPAELAELGRVLGEHAPELGGGRRSN